MEYDDIFNFKQQVDRSDKNQVDVNFYLVEIIFLCIIRLAYVYYSKKLLYTYVTKCQKKTIWHAILASKFNGSKLSFYCDTRI